MPDVGYDQRVVWILRQNGIGPFQLKEQYAAYKDKRAAFEAGYGTVDEVAALITPGVAAMLDLEDQMLADFTAEQQAPQPALVEESPGLLSRLLSRPCVDESTFWLIYTVVCYLTLILVFAVIVKWLGHQHPNPHL